MIELKDYEMISCVQLKELEHKMMSLERGIRRLIGAKRQQRVVSFYFY